VAASVAALHGVQRSAVAAALQPANQQPRGHQSAMLADWPGASIVCTLAADTVAKTGSALALLSSQ
jgi:hypothetical protein